jgi:hypothetical protein
VSANQPGKTSTTLQGFMARIEKEIKRMAYDGAAEKFVGLYARPGTFSNILVTVEIQTPPPATQVFVEES